MEEFTFETLDEAAEWINFGLVDLGGCAISLILRLPVANMRAGYTRTRVRYFPIKSLSSCPPTLASSSTGLPGSGLYLARRKIREAMGYPTQKLLAAR